MADVPSSGPVVVGGYEAKDVLLNVEFNHAGNDYTEATFNIFGPGTGAGPNRF